MNNRHEDYQKELDKGTRMGLAVAHGITCCVGTIWSKMSDLRHSKEISGIVYHKCGQQVCDVQQEPAI
jgi:hypothetical protein